MCTGAAGERCGGGNHTEAGIVGSAIERPRRELQDERGKCYDY